MYKAVRVTKDIHKELRVLSALEGKGIMEMLKLLIEYYKNRKGILDVPTSKATTKDETSS